MSVYGFTRLYECVWSKVQPFKNIVLSEVLSTVAADDVAVSVVVPAAS